jgi:hypothetical protein
LPINLRQWLLRGHESGRAKVACGSKRLVGERQLTGIKPSTPAFWR